MSNAPIPTMESTVARLSRSVRDGMACATHQLKRDPARHGGQLQCRAQISRPTWDVRRSSKMRLWIREARVPGATAPSTRDGLLRVRPSGVRASTRAALAFPDCPDHSDANDGNWPEPLEKRTRCPWPKRGAQSPSVIGTWPPRGGLCNKQPWKQRCVPERP